MSVNPTLARARFRSYTQEQFDDFMDRHKNDTPEDIERYNYAWQLVQDERLATGQDEVNSIEDIVGPDEHELVHKKMAQEFPIKNEVYIPIKNEVYIFPNLKCKANLEISYQKFEIEASLDNYNEEEYEVFKVQIIDFISTITTGVSKLFQKDEKTSPKGENKQKKEDPKDSGPTDKQKNLLFRLGFTEEEIADIKTSAEASHLISKYSSK